MAQGVVAGRYRLEREVGRGGMATVYLAVDEKHQREVALKVLRPDLAVAVGADRFLREIEITARLNHPHILPLLDSGTEDGLFYYVMPHVAGGSLRLLLDGDAIPLEAVTRITREVAAALDHAHARDVIHRDIKPENILFNEGLAVVSDFGIAKALTGIGTRMTGTGLSVGTLGYMSPEQALGTAELDARSDVYSLGSVVYEMLVGETPAAWPGAEDVELGRFEELPATHRDRLDAFPGRVQPVLVRALALRPQHRFAAPGELADALTAASGRNTRFSDDEVRQLLRRAAELQADRPAEPGSLTIGHVEQIAAEVGIPPEHVREAAREMDRGVPVPPPVARSERAAPLGDTGDVERRAAEIPSARVAARMGRDWKKVRKEWNRLVATEVVDGEVPEAAFPAMVAEINRSLDMVGHASIVGGTLTWTPATQSDDTRRVLVQVAAVQGRTTIHVREDLRIRGMQRMALAVGGVFGAGFGGALGEAIGMGDPGGLVVIFLAVGVLGAVRAVIGIDASEHGPQIKGLAGSLVTIGRTALGLSEPPAGAGAGAAASHELPSGRPRNVVTDRAAGQTENARTREG